MTAMLSPAESSLDEKYGEWQRTIRFLAQKAAPFDQNGLTTDDLFQAGSLAFCEAFSLWDQGHDGHKAWMRQVIAAAIDPRWSRLHPSVALFNTPLPEDLHRVVTEAKRAGRRPSLWPDPWS